MRISIRWRVSGQDKSSRSATSCLLLDFNESGLGKSILVYLVGTSFPALGELEGRAQGCRDSTSTNWKPAHNAPQLQEKEQRLSNEHDALVLSWSSAQERVRNKYPRLSEEVTGQIAN